MPPRAARAEGVSWASERADAQARTLEPLCGCLAAAGVPVGDGVLQRQVGRGPELLQLGQEHVFADARPGPGHRPAGKVTGEAERLVGRGVAGAQARRRDPAAGRRVILEDAGQAGSLGKGERSAAPLGGHHVRPDLDLGAGLQVG
jgi:hypothetical protein